MWAAAGLVTQPPPPRLTGYVTSPASLVHVCCEWPGDANRLQEWGIRAFAGSGECQRRRGIDGG